MKKNTFKKKDKKASKSVWAEAMSALIVFSGWVVVPVIVGSFLGMFLDERFNTKPWLFLFSVGTAFIISMIGLVRVATDKLKSFEDDNKKDEE